MNFENADLTKSFANIKSFLETHIVTPSMAFQLVLICLVFLVALWLRHIMITKSEGVVNSRVGRKFNKFIEKHRARISNLKTIIWPLIAGLILWFAQRHLAPLNLGPYQMTFEAVRLVAILTLAFAVIRFISTFIASKEAAKLFLILAWSTAALAALGWLNPLINTLDTIGFTTGETTISVWRLIKVIILLTLFFWLAHKAVVFLQNQINKTGALAPSLRVLFSKITAFMLYAAAFLFALSLVGIDLTALAVFTGALGVGIGFGLQKIISNFISGIILLLDKSLKPGDVIEVETGNGTTYGWVEKLGLRYTSITTRDGTETLIPNETFITNPVTNWSYSNSKVRRKIPIGIAYDSDVEQAMALCVEAASTINRVLDHPAPVCQLRGFGDSAVNLEVRFWLGDPEKGVKNVESEVNLAIWKAFQQAGIAIPFPQRDVNLRIMEDDKKKMEIAQTSQNPIGKTLASDD